MKFKIVDYYLDNEELTRMEDLFWLIYADETKDRPEVRESSRNVLRALKEYRESLKGNFV